MELLNKINCIHDPAIMTEAWNK